MNKIVITISRSYGSGGRELGEKIAKALDIPFYDKKIIEMMSNQTGLDESFFDKLTLKRKYHFTQLGGIAALSLNSHLFLVQSQLIEKLSENSCVIIGRCSDYILKEQKDALHVFVYANKEDRIHRCVNDYQDDIKKIEEKMIEIDESRKNYYQYFTDQIWGEPSNYDLCINTSKMKIDDVAEMIISYVRKQMMKENS